MLILSTLLFGKRSAWSGNQQANAREQNFIGYQLNRERYASLFSFLHIDFLFLGRSCRHGNYAAVSERGFIG